MEAGELGDLIERENLFVLATRPGEESTRCGALIAEACTRGRPPLVAVLTDGSRRPASNDPDAVALRHQRETEVAVARLGLAPERLFLLGLHDGTAPRAGPQFEALAAGVRMLMWRRDCGVICAPADTDSSDHAAAWALAGRVAELLGVRRLGYALRPGNGLGLAWQEQRRHAAIAAHAALGPAVVVPEWWVG